MGYESAADHGVGMRAIVKALERIKADAYAAEAEGETEEANQLFKVGAFICAVTFRGGPGSPPTNHGASISPYSYRPARRPIPLTIEEIIAIGHYFLACK